jgi:hypothetical protein
MVFDTNFSKILEIIGKKALVMPERVALKIITPGCVAINVNLKQIENGYVSRYRRYCDKADYIKAEVYARTKSWAYGMISTL